MQACCVLRTCSGNSKILVRRLPLLSDHPRTVANVASTDLLRKTVSLLPRALSGAGPDSSHFWTNVLERSITELSNRIPSKATIAVCGFDKWACPRDLVTALLEEPLTSDPTCSDILRNRWKNAPSCVNIEYGKLSAFAGQLSIPSDWLQRFPHPIRLTELPDLASLSSIGDETDSLLLSSDVLLMLCDPVVTSLPELVIRAKHLLDKPNTILILTSCSISEPHYQLISRTLSDTGCHPGHVLFVDPRRALGATTALHANPASPSSIDRYQREALDSRISAVSTAINEILCPKNLLDVREATAHSQIHGAVAASFRSLAATKKDIDRVASQLDEVLSGIHLVQAKTRCDIFGKTGEGDKVETVLSLGTKELNKLLASLSFWKMVWRIDEIGALVSAAVQGEWCKGLENELVLQTGRLDVTQEALSVSAFNLLSSSPLRSPVLENRLEQLRRSPTYALTPCSLTQPIHRRRSQLVQHTTAKLHREAQSAVVGAFGGVLSGAGLGWWLVFGEHILSLGVGAEAGTAIGAGALLAVSSLRWAVGKWERAKRSWMQDSARVGEGLTRDLRDTVQRTLDDNVTIIASTACRGMQDLIDRRCNEMDQLQGELCELDSELRAQTRALWTEQSQRCVKKVDVE